MDVRIFNVDTKEYRMVPVYVRYKKDRVEVVRKFKQSLPANEQIVELHLDERGK